MSHVRSATAAVVLIATAVVFRRPDLLVLATPFAVVTVWSTLTRPSIAPRHHCHLGHSRIREGDATTWHVRVDGAPGTDVVSAVLREAPWIQRRPAAGARAVAAEANGAAEATIDVRSTRWGRRAIEPGHVMVASGWGAFYCSFTTERQPIVTLPIPAHFDPDVTSRPTDGLVGQDRSVRPGEGGEFAGIRPFQVGDRMRRINWPRSLRTDGLHVNSTWADQDTHVAIVIDAGEDVGMSEGVDGSASSLDMTVRAAGAIAHHYARRGDRVSLGVFGAVRGHSIPPATGQAHLVRILDTLTVIQPATVRSRRAYGVRRPPVATNGSQMTVMLSPLISSVALDYAVELGRHGMPVAVVDTLPRHVTTDDDELIALAWRIRLLERRRETRMVQAAGIPVVAWTGARSLDQFLRDIARRACAPRMSVR